MPLWLQGAVEALQLAVLSLLPLLVAILAVYFTGGLGSPSPDLLGRFIGQAWLLMHAVPFSVSLPGADSAAAAQSGVFSLVPLGLLLIPFFLARRAGRRLARAAYTDQLWQPLLSAVLLYALAGLAVGYAARTPEASASPVLAALIPLIPMLVGLLTGVRREAGSWIPLIGQSGVDRISGWGQVSRWTGSYLWSVARAGFLAVIAFLGLATLLLAVNLALHWAEIVAVYQGVRAGPVGGAVLTLAQIAFLPNLAVWTMAWSAGPGFALGVGSSVSPLATEVAPVPAIPVLAALPVGQLDWGVLALLLPVLAGLLAGWWFLREGENHLADWFALKVEPPWLATIFSTVSLGALIGLAAGVLSSILAWLSQGSLGFGRLTDIGPNPFLVAAWVAVEVAIGAAIGHSAAPWLEGLRMRRQEREEFDPFASS
ncbi:DUF6350 family protein [Acaricomes phytoseiuli]|uniref:cell division protein PerM n=1 Tax=Acaricomes phytoseiuli TaxID=291968 RepID=UPI0003691D53|nr:DUF6350 family protein [Acaricomes phytoseiuli]